MTLFNDIHTKAHATEQDQPLSLGAILARPFVFTARFLRAYSDMRKFQALSKAHRADAGLSEHQAQNMTIRDFMAQPRR